MTEEGRNEGRKRGNVERKTRNVGGEHEHEVTGVS